MAGQPEDDHAADSAGEPGRPFAANSASAVTASRAGSTSWPDPAFPLAGPLPAPRPGYPADPAPARSPSISEFGTFDWFVEDEHFGDRARSGGQRRLSRRGSGSGALLPGEWAKPLETAGPRDAVGAGHWPAVADAEGKPGRSATAGPPLGRPPSRLRRARLTLVAGGLALACTVLGGVIGGYIALHSQNSATNPDYSLGTLPPALKNRPPYSVAGIAARVMPSVVMIKVNGGEGTGSGFIIHGGYIITDNHVVTLDGTAPTASIQVYFSNGYSARGTVVGRDPFSDIAIIKADGASGLPALTLGNSTGVEVGDPVIAVGSPLGLADTVTSGIVSAVGRPVQPGTAIGPSPQVYFDAIQTDAPINPGNSGGPLVNSRGQVIGIDAAIDTLGGNPLTGTQGGSIGLGFAIPVNQARRVTLELIRTGHAAHAVIGAAINLAWNGTGAQIMPAKPGGRSTVTPGGPAANAGLKPGDVIVRFAGQPVNNSNTLLDAVRSQAPGARASVTFVRNGQKHTVSIQLGSAVS
jgi:S1-C subfamily serine protease